MSRKMFFSSAASTDEAVMAVADQIGPHVLVWPWLFPYLDDWGRGLASPRVIKNAVFPAFPISEDDIAAALDAFEQADLIIRYETSDGRPVMSVDPAAWSRIQTHIPKSKREDDSKSQFPRPPSNAKSPKHGSSAISSESQHDSSENRSSPHFTSPHFTSPHFTSPHFTSPATSSTGSEPLAVENPPPKHARRHAERLGTTPELLWAHALAVAEERRADGYPVRNLGAFAGKLLKDDPEVHKRARASAPADPDSANLLRQLAAGKTIDEALA